MVYSYRHTIDNGRLAMSVINPYNSDKLWSSIYPSFTQDFNSGELIADDTLIDLGIMKSVNDVDGLSAYLKEQGIIQAGDSLNMSYINGLNNRIAGKFRKGGAFDASTPEEAVKRIMDGELLINLRDDYRIAYRGLDKFTISFPSGAWERIVADEKEVIDFLTSAFKHAPKFAKGGEASGFDKLASGIGKKLIGKKVPKKYQKEYGKTYGKADASAAGQNIAGSIVNEHHAEEDNKPTPKAEKKHSRPVSLEKLNNELRSLEKRRMKAIKDNDMKAVEEIDALISHNKSDGDTLIDEAKSETGKNDQKIPLEVVPEKTETRLQQYEKKYGVSPEVVYKKALTFKDVNMDEALSAAALDVIKKEYDGNNVVNETIAALLETPTLPDITTKGIHKYGFNIDKGPLRVMSLSKPKIPDNTKPIESLATIVSKDDLRPAMMGVYHDANHNRLVATNAHVLAYISTPIKEKSKITNIKTGATIDARYPDYPQVIPEDNVLICERVNAKQLYEQLNGIIKADSILKGSVDSPRMYIQFITPLGFWLGNPYLIRDLLSFFFKNDTGTLRFEFSPIFNDNNCSTKALAIKSVDNEKLYGLTMPLFGNPYELVTVDYDLGKYEISDNYQTSQKDSYSVQRHRKELKQAHHENDAFGIEYHTERLHTAIAEQNESIDEFNKVLVSKGMKPIERRTMGDSEKYTKPNPKGAKPLKKKTIDDSEVFAKGGKTISSKYWDTLKEFEKEYVRVRVEQGIPLPSIKMIISAARKQYPDYIAIKGKGFITLPDGEELLWSGEDTRVFKKI
jgi:hypothetical protein